MSLSNGQWQEIHGYCQTMAGDLPFEHTPGRAMLPLMVWDERHYAWQGRQEEVATYLQLRTRAMVVGERALYTAISHHLRLEASDASTFRLIQFSPEEQEIHTVSHGMITTGGELPSFVRRGVRRLQQQGYWPPRPGDYLRLYEEMQRGAADRLSS